MDTSFCAAFFAATLPAEATSFALLLMVCIVSTVVVLAALGIYRQD